MDDTKEIMRLRKALAKAAEALCNAAATENPHSRQCDIHLGAFGQCNCRVQRAFLAATRALEIGQEAKA